MKLRIIVVLLILFLLVVFLSAPHFVDRFANAVNQPPVENITPQTRSFHDSLFIADLHCDALLWGSDLLQRRGWGHVDLPRMQEGNMALQVFSIVSKTPFGLNYEENSETSDMITLLAIASRWPMRTWNSLTERALYQAGRLKTFAAKSDGEMMLIESRTDLLDFLAARSSGRQVTASLLAIEGAQVMEGNFDNLQVLYDAGFRMMAPTHFFDTALGGSAHGMTKGGLTALGRRTIARMESLGMVVDIAHASPSTVDDVLAVATQPVVVSHTGVKGTCESPRNLSDAHIRGVAATGGVVGIGFFEGATCGDDIAHIVTAMRYVRDLVDAEHVALGSDFDGDVATPFDVARMPELTDALLASDLTRSEVRLIMGENVKRVLLKSLKD